MRCAAKLPCCRVILADFVNSLAYRGGVASAITAPAGFGVFQGLSVSFSLGARNKLEKGAVLQEIVAVHISISSTFASSVSTQIATLRRLLLDAPKNEHEFGFKQASEASILLTTSAPGLINSIGFYPPGRYRKFCRHHRKSAVTEAGGRNEARYGHETDARGRDGSPLTGIGDRGGKCRRHPNSIAVLPVRLGTPENVGLQHRLLVSISSLDRLAGPPLTAQSSAALLFSHNVTVGLGPQGIQATASISNWAVRNLRFDMAWVNVFVHVPDSS